MSVFSSKNLKTLFDPISKENPVTTRVLGICAALAVTVNVEPAAVLGLSVIFVLAFSNLIISLMREFIPNSIRIIVQLVVLATLVIIVDQVLKAFAYDVSKQLSVFVGLIISNCIILGRLEAFALQNKPIPSLMDGIGNGVGFAVLLVIVAIVRELFGSGTLYGFQVIPQAFYDFGYMNNNMMILPPMALIVVGVIIWIQRAVELKKQ
jgi:Na+-transporting NADH:ubiquinone oxidoreductase subunit D